MYILFCLTTKYNHLIFQCSVATTLLVNRDNRHEFHHCVVHKATNHKVDYNKHLHQVHKIFYNHRRTLNWENILYITTRIKQNAIIDTVNFIWFERVQVFKYVLLLEITYTWKIQILDVYLTYDWFAFLSQMI